MSYGTGAIMAVPAHDQRDYEFASKFKIPIINVINPVTGEKQIDPVTKNKIVCVVEDKNGKILTNNWKPELGGRLLIGGTIEDGESPVDAAMREVIEETGYEDLELVGVSDETVYHEYYALFKKTPTRAITKLVHLRIKSSAQVDITHEVSEMGNFEVQWVDKEMAFKEIYDEQHLRALDLFVFDKVYTGEGIMVNSGKYDDMNSSEMREKITTELTKKKQGNEKVNYKIHDWLISRQRYWGTPIPIIHCDKCGEVPVDYQDLPVRLPEDVEFEPTGQSPLLKITDFVNTFCPKCGGPAKRETDTMDTFVDSSWYYLRYPNPNYTKGPFDPEAVKTWLPVDHYIGGIEHAILHLLYSRFITKVLHDYAKLPIEEPFKKLTNQGMILGPDGQKMSKSKGNVVDPDEQVGSYGSDSLRLYMMFMGPFDQGGAYDLGGIAGTRRFIDRVWTLVTGLIETTEDTLASSKQNAEVETRLLSELNKTVKKVTHDLERLSFNTAIAFMMEFVNTANKILPDLTYNAAPVVWKEALMTLLRLMAPFVPHVSEELWAALGQEDSIHSESWPAWDDELVKDEMITIVVQVNGRVRANLLVASGTDMKEIVDIATKEPSVKQYLKQGTLQKTIEVANKLINFVVS
jgi:leucyl-tRNA synthetase